MPPHNEALPEELHTEKTPRIIPLGREDSGSESHESSEHSPRMLELMREIEQLEKAQAYEEAEIEKINTALKIVTEREKNAGVPDVKGAMRHAAKIAAVTGGVLVGAGAYAATAPATASAATNPTETNARFATDFKNAKSLHTAELKAENFLKKDFSKDVHPGRHHYPTPHIKLEDPRDVEFLRQAFTAQESGGNYSIVNTNLTHGRQTENSAYGRYQIIPKWWFPLIDLDPNNAADRKAFLANHALQDHTFDLILKRFADDNNGDIEHMIAEYIGGSNKSSYGTKHGNEIGDGAINMNSYVHSVYSRFLKIRNKAHAAEQKAPVAIHEASTQENSSSIEK